MNIYEFINSKDIRAHCEKIGHTFNSIEAAFLIYQSQNHTLEEKHTAWNELIKTMPDMVIERRLHCPHNDSLHDFLRRYMTLEDRLLTVFFQTEEAWVYRFDPVVCSPDDCCKEDYDWKCETGERLYCSFSDGLAFEKEDWDDSPFFCVVKMRICAASQDESSRICIRIDQNGVPFEIHDCQNVMTDAETDLYGSFEGMWIDVPTPFRRGDIVFTNYQRPGSQRDPFVLTTLCTDKDTEYHRGKYKFRLKYGDTSQMFASGHRLKRSNGELWYERAHDYLCLEYFRGDVSGYRRVLKVIQDFYQNKQDVGSCMIAYHYILSEEYWKQQKWNYSCMLDGYQYSGKNTDEM